MMRTFLLLAALAAAPAIAAKQDDPARLDKLLQGRVAGKPVDCLPTTRYSDSRTIGRVVAYSVGGAWYVNRFANGCPSLRNDRVIISRHPSGRICRGDIADIAMPQPPAIPVGTCVFDSFTPYRKP